MEEIIVSGYCRAVDGNRILCCDLSGEEPDTDCLYPKCEFAAVCRLIKSAFEKAGK